MIFDLYFFIHDAFFIWLRGLRQTCSLSSHTLHFESFYRGIQGAFKVTYRLTDRCIWNTTECLKSDRSYLKLPWSWTKHSSQPMHLFQIIKQSTSLSWKHPAVCVCVVALGIQSFDCPTAAVNLYMLVNGKAGKFLFDQFQTLTDLHVVQSSFPAREI